MKKKTDGFKEMEVIEGRRRHRQGIFYVLFLREDTMTRLNVIAISCNFINRIENELNKILYLLYILLVYIY